MKPIVLAVLVLLVSKSYAQHNLYTFNNGSLITADKIKLYFEQAKKKLPATHEITAVIYHKAIKVTADGINVLIRHDQKSLLGKLLLVLPIR